MTNTAEIVEVNGVPCRLWVGKTESGIEVQCLVTRVAVLKTEDCSQFERELVEQPAPRMHDGPLAFPLRLIL